MTDSDVLRQMSAAPMQIALQAGADALDLVPRLRDENTRLQATIAGLEDALADAVANARPVVPDTHTAAAGDTLLKIGRRYLVQAMDIKAWNGLTSDTIRPGQVLQLKPPVTSPKPDPKPEPAPVGKTVWSWDLSRLGDDKTKPDAQQIAAHKALFGVDNIQYVREFFGSAVPRWDSERMRALTEKDSVVISSLSTDRAGIAKFLAATPEKFRQRPGQVYYAFGHEREADLTVGPSLNAWLDGNQMIADLLHDSPWDTQSEDHLVKILLHYSQHHEKNPSTPNREQMYGGQDFGVFGEDEYSPRAMPRYENAEELIGDYVRFIQSIGLPGAIPELGAERVPSDTTGAGRAKFITDVAAYVNSLRMPDGTPLIRFCNWWCADGFRDGARVLHHLEEHGADSPEVTAYKALMV